MVDHPERSCPICSAPFQSRNVKALTCSPVCSKRAKKLREAVRAYNAGQRDLRPETLEAAMQLLEADEGRTETLAARPHVEVLDNDCEDVRDERRWKKLYAARLAQERRWMREWREAKLRMIARGHRPRWATPRMIEEAAKAYPAGLPRLAA